MKINLLIYSPLSLRFGGGFEKWILDLIPILTKKGINCSLLTTDSIVNNINRYNKTYINKICNEIGFYYIEYSSYRLKDIFNPVGEDNNMPMFELLDKVSFSKPLDKPIETLPDDITKLVPDVVVKKLAVKLLIVELNE